MDAAQAQALANYDNATRKPAYAKIESLLVRDAPVDFLWWFRNIQVLNPTSKASIQTRSSKRGISRHGLSR